MLNLQEYDQNRKKRIELEKNIKSMKKALGGSFLFPETKAALEISIDEAMQKLGELDANAEC